MVNNNVFENSQLLNEEFFAMAFTQIADGLVWPDGTPRSRGTFDWTHKPMDVNWCAPTRGPTKNA